MKNEIRIFESPQFGQIRTAGTADEPLFCLSDICRILELRTDNVKQRLKTPGTYSIGVGVQTGTKADGTPAIQFVEMLFVNEPNLYRVIMRSDKPQVEAFQDWVCEEVLPTIRKQGYYSAGGNDFASVTAEILKSHNECVDRLTRLVEKLTDNISVYVQQPQPAQQPQSSQQYQKPYPKPPLEDDQPVNPNKPVVTYTFSEVAEVVGKSSVHAFTSWAQKRGIIMRENGRWIPTPQYRDKGYFVLRKFTRLVEGGTKDCSYYKITQEGYKMIALALASPETVIND